MQSTFHSRMLETRFGGWPSRAIIAVALSTALIACLSISIQIGTPPLQGILQADSIASCTVSSSEFQSWFTAGSISPNGAVKPADSVLFDEAQNLSSGSDPQRNCNFYKWSEQMFLWLSSRPSSRYGGGTRVFNSPAFYDVSAPDPATGERKSINNLQDLVAVDEFADEKIAILSSDALPEFGLRSPPLGEHGLPIAVEKDSGRLLEIVPTILSPNGNSLIRDASGELVEIARIDVRRVRENGERPSPDQPKAGSAHEKAVLFGIDQKPIDIRSPIRIDPRDAPGLRPTRLETIESHSQGQPCDRRLQ